AEDGIRDYKVTGVQTCALPILRGMRWASSEKPAHTHVHRQVAPAHRRKAQIVRTTEKPFRRRSSIPFVLFLSSCRSSRYLWCGRSEERRVGKECGCGSALYCRR